MSSMITNLFLMFFTVTGIGASYFLYQQDQLSLSVLITAIMLSTWWIFKSKKASAWRFMYPGLLTFLIFMIIPILFTVYIGFTNLSTGHFLTQSKVFDLLQEELIIQNDRGPFDFKLISVDRDHKKYRILVGYDQDQVLFADFELGEEQNINLLPLENSSVFLLGLGRAKIYDFKEELKKLAFITPDGDELRYYRTTQLAPQTKRYTPLASQQLLDNVTNIHYYPDHTTGYYTDGKHNLAPGFYVPIGFKNFGKLFTDDRIKGPFLKILMWTFSWAFFTVIFTFIVGMFLAILINEGDLKFRTLYRILFIIPYSIPFFISVLIFKGLLNKDFGIINQLIAEYTPSFVQNIIPVLKDGDKINWLGNPFMAKISVLLVNLWLGFPYMFLVTTGILQSIPKSIYEAAALDGAGRWAKFKNITLPLIMSAVGPLLVGTFAFNFNNFVGIYLLTGGNPPMKGVSFPLGETDILISATFRLAFEGGGGSDFGLASSITILIFFIIAILTLVNFKLSGMMNDERRA